VKTVKAATGQAAHMKSPELVESLKELKEIPGIARITKLSGINFPDAITTTTGSGPAPRSPR
jgi:hypothetical protein